MQVKIKLKSLTIGDTTHERGAVVDLPDEAAAAHARAGHVEIIETPKPKRTTKPKAAEEE